MLDECLMKQECGYVYCIEYQAGTRKFTLAGESKCDFLVLSGDKWREKKFLLGDKSA